MNVNRLAQLYPRFTIWERIRLFLAASHRSDDHEYRRLFTTSPMQTWHFSEHMLAEAAVHVLALIYISEQLDAATNYFFPLWKLQDADDPQPEHWRQAVEVYAYVFTANAEACRRFCHGLGVEPPSVLPPSPVYPVWPASTWRLA